MASNYTPNYNLNQWSADDRVLRTDFNTDNARIDAAIAAVDSRVDGKASEAALESLKKSVDSLKTTVSLQGVTLAGKGNCQFYTTTYTGTGEYTYTNPNSLTFPHKPMLVIITANGSRLTLVQGETTSWSDKLGGGDCNVGATWNGNTVTWSGASDRGQMNERNRTYRVLALLNVDW